MEGPAERDAPARVSITAAQVRTAAAGWGMECEAAPFAELLALYGNLLMAWNARLNLTSIRSEAQLIERHLLEGLFAAMHHPEAVSSLDFGSGTGVPGLPIAIARPEIRVTLAESQQKKASFLREAVRSLHLTATVHSGRAELLPPDSFSAVWMRAVDRSAGMMPVAASLVTTTGHLCLLTSETGAAVATSVMGKSWRWQTISIPRSESRLLHIGTRV